MLTEQTDLTQLGPFHEAITWLIRTASPEQMNVLRMLLKTTQVQKGHDGIIIAWERRRAELAEEYGLFDFDCLGDVANDLLAQKQAAEAAATNLSRSFDFDGKERALMIVIEKIFGILQNRTRHWREKDGDHLAKLFEVAKRINWAKNEEDFKIAITDLQSQ